MERWLLAFLIYFSTTLFAPALQARPVTITIPDLGDFQQSRNALEKRANLFISDVSPLLSASFSNDSTLLNTTSYPRYGSRQGFLKIWNLDTFGSPVETLEVEQEGSIISASFSPDASLMASLSPSYRGEAVIRLWNLKHTSENRSPTLMAVKRHGKENREMKARFSPDGRLLMTATYDNSVRLWSVNKGADSRAMQFLFSLNHTDKITSARFSPDGTMILTTSQDKTARLWRISDLRSTPVAQVMPHEATVYQAAFSPDGSRILTASASKKARLWSTSETSSNPLIPIKEMAHDEKVRSVSFSPDNALMITTSGNKVKVWTFNKQGALKRIALIPHQGSIDKVQFRPGHQQLLVSTDNYSQSGFFTLWDLANIQKDPQPKIIDFQQHKQENQLSIEPAFSKDGQYLITSMPNGSAMVWQFTQR